MIFSHHIDKMLPSWIGLKIDKAFWIYPLSGAMNENKFYIYPLLLQKWMFGTNMTFRIKQFQLKTGFGKQF